MDLIGDGDGGESATPREEHSIGNGNGSDSATPMEEHWIGNGDGGNSATPRDVPPSSPLLISQPSISTGFCSPRPVDVGALKRSYGSTFENGYCKVCKRMHFVNLKSFINCLNAGNCCSWKCTCQDPLSKADSEAIILRFRQQEEKNRLKRASGASKNEDSKGCSCKLSKCMKLYCVCFNNGEYCAEGCECQDCYNRTDNEDMIRDIRQQIRSRSPCAFERKMEQPATESSPNSGVRSFDQDENGCGAFLWKDEVANWQLAEVKSMTCERENWREERRNLIAVVEKLESSLCVFIEVKKIRNAYLRKIYHAIIVACCIIILVFLFRQA